MNASATQMSATIRRHARTRLVATLARATLVTPATAGHVTVSIDIFEVCFNH